MEETQHKIEKFYIHFDQDEHYMPVEDYEKLIKSTKIIFDNITKDIIKTKELDLIVFAPKEGCLIATLGLIFTAGAFAVGSMSFILQFMDSPTGKYIIKRLLHKTPIQLIDNGFDKIEFVKELIKAIFATSQAKLKEIIDEIEKFNEEITKLDKSLKAVSDFYQMCNRNKDIKAIGFSEDNVFTITKNEFCSHMTNDITRDKGIHNEYKELTIVKPVTVRTSKGKWTLAETGTKDEQNYSMEDIIFKEKTLNGDFVKQSPNDDEIIALTEYKLELKNGYENKKDRKVIEIYKFNKEKFENRELPKDFELNNSKKKAENTGQMNLFDQQNNNQEDNNA